MSSNERDLNKYNNCPNIDLLALENQFEILNNFTT